MNHRPDTDETDEAADTRHDRPQDGPKNGPHDGTSNDRDGRSSRDRIWTIPNLLCAVRLAGTPVLVCLAWLGQTTAFITLLLVLIGTDWIDGRLARWLRQQSTLGARLDSIADVALFAALLAGALLLKGSELMAEWGWIVAAVVSYALSAAAAAIKFHRLPSYHTRLAKLSSYLVILGAVLALADVTMWVLRVSMLTVTLGNLEATAITRVLPCWRANVPSVRAALRERGRETASPKG